jgi:hypothetical protein
LPKRVIEKAFSINVSNAHRCTPKQLKFSFLKFMFVGVSNLVPKELHVIPLKCMLYLE